MPLDANLATPGKAFVPTGSPMHEPIKNADDDPDGRWITIDGTHVLVKDGESVDKAFERTTGKPLEGGSKPPSAKSTKPSSSQKPSESPKRPAEKAQAASSDSDKALVKSMSKASNRKTGDQVAAETDKALTDQIAYGKTFADDEALNHYTALGYAPTNAYLRGQTTEEQAKKTGNFKKEHIAKIDAAIASSPDLPEGITLYRGIGERGVESMMGMKPGDTCSDKGFQSFSTNPYNAVTFTTRKNLDDGSHKVLVRAVTGKGQKGFTVGGGEHEVIMPRGQSWKVVSNTAVTTGVHAGKVTTHVITVVPA